MTHGTLFPSSPACTCYHTTPVDPLHVSLDLGGVTFQGGIEDCFQLSFCADRIIWRAARAEEALSKLGKKYFVLFNTFDDSGPLHLFYCSTNLTVCQLSTISQGSQSVSNWCVTMD